MGIHNPIVAGFVADSMLRQLNRENVRLCWLADRYRERSTMGFAFGLGFIGVMV